MIEWGYNLGKLKRPKPVLPSPGIMVNKGNHPLLWAYFRLVKYYFVYPDTMGYRWRKSGCPFG